MKKEILKYAVFGPAGWLATVDIRSQANEVLNHRYGRRWRRLGPNMDLVLAGRDIDGFEVCATWPLVEAEKTERSSSTIGNSANSLREKNHVEQE